MDFLPDGALLDLLDDELQRLCATSPDLTEVAVFENLNGAPRLLADYVDPGGHGGDDDRTRRSIRGGLFDVVFAHPRSVPDAAVDAAMMRAASRIGAIVEPHLRLHVLEERLGHLEGRRRPRRAA